MDPHPDKSSVTDLWPESTCWDVIAGAAAGDAAAREEFARRYEPIVRAYLQARWRRSGRAADVDDAGQDVFVECFRRGGVLARADGTRGTPFRAFLFGVVRNVARRVEESAARRREIVPPSTVLHGQSPPDERGLSQIFDRNWALQTVKEAARLQRERAEAGGADAMRRAELLRLRFQERLPIREIARLWEEDAARLHHAYAKAREEFKEALITVVARQHPGTTAEIERECFDLLALLS